MFDGVFNHASSKSRWFQRFLNGRPGYEDFFVAFSTQRCRIDPDYLRLILRPRTSDLLTPFRTINGTRYVWTTFSPDQVDLNFRNPRVLMRVVEILLYYVRRGADLVRLDAVTYIWRELGTSCAHLRETHALVQAVSRHPRCRRPAGRRSSPRPTCRTTTTSATSATAATRRSWSTTSRCRRWCCTRSTPGRATTLAALGADARRTVSDTATYFNFLSSHDGVGLLGARGILTEDEIAALVDRTVAHGGFVSYRSQRRRHAEPVRAEHHLVQRAQPRGQRGVAGAAGGALPGRARHRPGAARRARHLPADAVRRQERHRGRAEGRREAKHQPAHLRRGDADAAARTTPSAGSRRWRAACGAWCGGASSSQPSIRTPTQAVLDLGPSVFGAATGSAIGVQQLVALTNVTDREVRVRVPVGGPRWRASLARRAVARALPGDRWTCCRSPCRPTVSPG